MTNDEDEWLSDFLETAQASARQSQLTAEKDYASRLKLFTPRFARAQPIDREQQLAKRLAASEALAGQRKFDAASDALDEAFVLAGDLLRTAATSGAEENPPTEEGVAADLAVETAETVGELAAEEPVAETVADEPAADTAADEPVAETAPAGEVMEAAPEEPLTDPALEEPIPEASLEEPAAVTTEESTSEAEAGQLDGEPAAEDSTAAPDDTAAPDETAVSDETDETAESGPGSEDSGGPALDSFSVSVATGSTEPEDAEPVGDTEPSVEDTERKSEEGPPPELSEEPKSRTRR